MDKINEDETGGERAESIREQSSRVDSTQPASQRR